MGLRERMLSKQRLENQVRSKAKRLADISQKASKGSRLLAIRKIQKKFPDAKPKCPNCSYHSTGYDDFIEHLRMNHNASI